MKFLIAGLGSIGRRHLNNLKTLGETEILLYRTHRSTLPEDALAGLPVYTNLDEALAQRPDGVIISNPTSAHLGVAQPAAEAGCNLLIEKPISDSLDGLPALKASLERNHKQVVMGFHFHFHPVLRQVKALLESGELGIPLYAEAHWGEYLPDWHPWEDYRSSYAARAELGGGVVLTLSHPFDYLRWLIGEIHSLSAMTARQSDLEINVEDHADVSLRFLQGTLGHVHLDYYERPPAHWLEITCSNGHIHWHNTSGSVEIFNARNNQWQRFDPPARFERNDMFLTEMAHFIRVCRGEELSGCTLDDGIKALQIAEAVRQSSSQGSCLVQLP